MYHKYLSFGHDIVISAQRNNWPLPALGHRSPETGNSYRYINSGSIFSTAQAWIDAWDWMQIRERQFAGRPPETVGGRHIFNCDQAAWVDLYVNGQSDIVLDAECRVFQVLDQVDSTVGIANRDLQFEGRRVVNRETGGRPCLIHGAGDIPLASWASYILDPSPDWIWPLIDHIRQTPPNTLQNTASVEQLLLGLGLHDQLEGNVPDEMLQYTGKGLSIWQWPNQFAPYLAWLATQPSIRSYVEIGVNMGGSFIATVEYLRRFHPLALAIGVDPWQSPPVRDYVTWTAGVRFVAGTRTSDDLQRLVAQAGVIDLVLIDGDHSHDAVRADWEFARSCSRYVAFHDIATDAFPGVQSLWAEIRSNYRRTYEFVDQYPLYENRAGIGVVDLNTSG